MLNLNVFNEYTTSDLKSCFIYKPTNHIKSAINSINYFGRQNSSYSRYLSTHTFCLSYKNETFGPSRFEKSLSPVSFATCQSAMTEWLVIRQGFSNALVPRVDEKKTATEKNVLASLVHYVDSICANQ